jgi:hypothetical protein
MIISIDFDETYSAKPDMWNTVIESFLSHGCDVICVTARYDYEMYKVHNSIGLLIGEDKCYCTGRLYKKKYMKRKGIKVDIWIDDNPSSIVNPYWMSVAK